MDTPVELSNTATNVVVKMNKTILIGVAAGFVAGVGGKFVFDKVRARQALKGLEVVS